MAVYLRLVLDRLWEHRRVALLHDPGAGFLERLEDGGDRSLRVGDHDLAGERAEMRLELVAAVDADAVAEVLADIVADLLGRDEQFGGAVLVDQSEGQSDRRMLDVGAAHIEG